MPNEDVDAVRVVARHFHHARATPDGNARPPLEVLDERAAEDGVLQRHALGSRVGQERGRSLVEHRESPDELRVGSSQGSAEAQGLQVVHTGGMHQLAGKLFGRVDARVHQQRAKAERAQPRRDCAASRSTASN